MGALATSGEGSVNLGVSFMDGGQSGSAVINQLVRVQGALAGAWVAYGQVLASSASGGQPGQVPGQASRQKSAARSASTQPAVYRFRFGGEGGGSSGGARRAARSRCDPE